MSHITAPVSSLIQFCIYYVLYANNFGQFDCLFEENLYLVRALSYGKAEKDGFSFLSETN